MKKKHAVKLIFQLNGQTNTLLTMEPPNTNNNGASDNGGVSAVPPHSPLEPWVSDLACADGSEPLCEPVWDIDDPSNFHDAEFATTFDRRFVLPLEPSPALFVELFFPDSLLEEMAERTNQHARKWLPPSRRMEVTVADTSCFLAMCCCVGLVRLPCKRDCWRVDHEWWPIHPPAQHIKRDKFMCVWRHFHLRGTTDTPDDENDIDEDGIADEEEEQDASNEEEELEEEEDEEEPEDKEVVHDARWHAKVASFCEHVLRISRKICKRPGSMLSIGEMMKRFKGRSGQTHRMKIRMEK